MKKNNWTGERLETFVYDGTTIEHLHRYALACDFVAGKKVLDIACGVGYGTFLMSKLAIEIIGVDISEHAILEAKNSYSNKNLDFRVGSAYSIPVDSNYFDVVVSFETIEHHSKHDEMLADIKRVLKPGGLLIISSPDKLIYSQRRNLVNPFHKKELYDYEFKSLINKYFINANFLFQSSTFCSIIKPENLSFEYKEYEGNFSNVFERKLFEGMFIIAFASDNTIEQSTRYLNVFRDDKFMENIIEEKNLELSQQFRNSYSYRLGNLLLSPFSLIKKLFLKTKGKLN